MLFWILAAIVLAIATFIACLPLFRAKTGWTSIALALVFALPAGALVLYQDVGTPEALKISGTPRSTQSNDPHSGSAADTEQIDDMAAKLRSRLTETPEDLEGWILLSRTLKTMQRYPEALEALETAQRIAPDDAFVLVELVEARIFLSSDGTITGEMVSMLQSALNQDPGQQKALWLMGIAASQANENEAAIEYWETLLQALEPDSTIAPQVQEQIKMAQDRLGAVPETAAETGTPAAMNSEPVPAEAPTANAASDAGQMTRQVADAAEWTGTDVRISPSDALKADMPQGAVLYVMIRTPGPAVGPPIGVRRIHNPSLPLDITISDGDSMLQERKISSQSEATLQARLSLTGAPGAKSGDWQSSTRVIPLNSNEQVALLIDQKVE